MEATACGRNGCGEHPRDRWGKIVCPGARDAMEPAAFFGTRLAALDAWVAEHRRPMEANHERERNRFECSLGDR